MSDKPSNGGGPAHNNNSENPEFVWGAGAIAKIIGRNKRQTEHMLSRGYLPAKKVGGRWCGNKSRLRRLAGAE